MLSRIEAIYAARIRGDAVGLTDVIAEDASFRFAGETPMAQAFDAAGPVKLIDAVTGLNQLVTMHRHEIVTALAEGNRLAVLSTVEVSLGERAPFETQLYDLWTFDDDGKVSDGVEFIDTAKLASETRALAGKSD
jgi:ketosteroid isomerase-like protein